MLGYLEEIQRRHGLFVGAQRNFTFPGAEGAQTISRIMEGFRAQPPGAGRGLRRADLKDYKKRRGPLGREGGSAQPAALERHRLRAGGRPRVTLRPSGTEPKIKYYFELRETLASGEPMAQARARAEGRLQALIDAFLALARDRGQPA